MEGGENRKIDMSRDFGLSRRINPIRFDYI